MGYSTALLALVLAVPVWQEAPRVPNPEAVLGFQPGADFHLVSWPQVVDYCRKLDEASDRVLVCSLGESTEGRPFLVAVVADAATLRDLDRYKALQYRLSHPPDDRADDRENVRASKPVVLITCSIHSSETASTHMALELLHELATQDDPDTREVLENTILLLVPSVNPDGVDKVAEWYARSRGKPWEGGGMPWLYHKYAGHDTNRDWFMLNLTETRLLTRLLYREWYPTITYDVHQMGGKGARLFVPPFYDPINPNLDPRIHQSIAMIGAHMAAELAVAGKRGVLTNAMYDNWWNGGNRTTPQRHNMIGVLTEAASVRLASPVFLAPDELRADARGFREYKPATNFVDPWAGGWWRLRDIVEYELIAAKALLRLAARYRTLFQQQYLDLSRTAIEKGRTEPPFAWVVAADQADPGRAATLVRILHETGIEIDRARSAFVAGGLTYPAGSWVLPAAQPYRPHLKDMMERQVYPARFTVGGAAEPPYDVAGWTLPLQMGVKAVAVSSRFAYEGERAERFDPARPSDPPAANGSPDFYALANRANADFRVLAELADDDEARVVLGRVTIGGQPVPIGSLLVPARSQARRLLEADRLPPGVSLVSAYYGSPRFEDPSARARLRPRRIGLYQPWEPSMDEGWTRLILENHGIPYATLHNADVRAGGLAERIDVLLVPSISARVLRTGYGPNDTEPPYVGGLGTEGAQALREFVRGGGRIVFLENSCAYAIAELSLPVKELLGSLRTSEFYGPGSIVRMQSACPDGEPITLGMPEEWSAYFDRSLAFEADAKQGAKVIARYASSEVLQSGWLHGPEKLQGKAAIVEVQLGDGSVVLFGFPPQNRGQTHGTFRLLFNALLLAGLDSAP